MADGDTYHLSMKAGESYFLWIINVALNVKFSFTVPDHVLMVGFLDASYTKLLHTEIVMIGPG